MTDITYSCLLVEETGSKAFIRKVTTRSVEALPEGDLLVRVQYSSLNYKDALSASGNKGVSRKFPHTPGIDAAGQVAWCGDGTFEEGEQVLVTGYDLGMNTPGGFGQYIRIPSSWAVRLPPGLTLREAMALGTAGFTAALCAQGLENGGVRPGDGEVVVTGATGGVGSMAVSILAQAGYNVTAVTGKPEAEEYLGSLGAKNVVDRAAVLEGSDRPMMKEHWAGAVDVVGGETLAALIKAARYGGVVTCCGLVGSPDLPLNVFPFILRGVSLIGIDSVQVPMEPRKKVWERLAGEWKPDNLEETVTEIALEELDGKINDILAGKVTGRTVVKLD
ncbi:MAG: YhdH/YhfP family quinone oxidoreductase [bacterium]|nr:YhdH/YhfP family quinone oxidoreductase [bacterium]MDT8366740.1 YhdH/YhfP family quinone oxidoreductase [bacterium]